MCRHFPNFINKIKPVLPKSEFGIDINPLLFYRSSSAGSKSNSSASYWSSRSHHITQSRLFSISSLHNLKAEFKTLILWFVCRRTRINEAAERSEGHRHNLQRSEIWLHPLSEQTADTLLFIDAKHLQYDLLMCVIKLLLFFGGVCVSSFRWGHRMPAWDFAHVWLRVWLMHFERCN